jgi:hypothetical protein
MEEAMVSLIVLLSLIAVVAMLAAVVSWRSVSRALRHIPRRNEDFHLF